MINTYKVLLPKWVFESDNESDIEQNIVKYLQRYPHYVFEKLEDGFAICTLIE